MLEYYITYCCRGAKKVRNLIRSFYVVALLKTRKERQWVGEKSYLTSENIPRTIQSVAEQFLPHKRL